MTGETIFGLPSPRSRIGSVPVDWFIGMLVSAEMHRRAVRDRTRFPSNLRDGIVVWYRVLNDQERDGFNVKLDHPDRTEEVTVSAPPQAVRRSQRIVVAFASDDQQVLEKLGTNINVVLHVGAGPNSQWMGQLYERRVINSGVPLIWQLGVSFRVSPSNTDGGISTGLSSQLAAIEALESVALDILDEEPRGFAQIGCKQLVELLGALRTELLAREPEKARVSVGLIRRVRDWLEPPTKDAFTIALRDGIDRLLSTLPF